MFTYTLPFHTPLPDPKNRFSYFIFQAREEAGEKGGVAEEYWGPLLYYDISALFYSLMLARLDASSILPGR